MFGWIRRHPFISAFLAFVFADFPQWLSSIWSLWNSTPFFEWLGHKGVKIAMPHFSLLWITWPIGILLLGFIAWNSFQVLKRQKERTGVSEPASFLVTAQSLETTTEKYHKCSICNRGFLYTPSTVSGRQAITCPNCGHVDLLGSSETAKEAQRKAKPIAVKPLPARKLSVHSNWQYSCEILVSNENQSVSGAKVRLINVEPPFSASYGTSARHDLDGIHFSLIGCSDGVLHANQECRIQLFIVERSGGEITFTFPNGKIFSPAYVQGKLVEHILTVETAATGVDTNLSQFKLILSLDAAEPILSLELLNALLIHSADWWIEDKHSDVTKIVKSYLSEHLAMPCEIAVLGDPRPGLGKLLTIDYSFEGKRSKKTFKEHDSISDLTLK